MSSTYISICQGVPRSKTGLRFAHLRKVTGGGYSLFLASLFGLALLTALTLYPEPFRDSQVNANPGVANSSTTSVALSTAASGSSVTLIPGAGFKLSSSADTAAFDITTDNYTGYSVVLAASDDNQTLVNTDNSAYTISSITSSVDQSNFVMTNSALINRWGVKPNKYYNTSTSSTIANATTILPAPDQEGIVLDVTTSANSTGNSYSVAIGAMVDGTKPAGTYERATTLIATANPIVYLVNYADNTGDTITGLPSATAGSVTATNVTLDSAVPERSGYTFNGWCLGAVSDNGTVCSASGTLPGIKFNAGANFGIDQTIDNTSFTLYATWVINDYTITYGTVTGISSVSLDGTACTTALSAGGCTKTLTYNQTYDLVATPATGYSFTSWSAGDYGSIANTTNTGATTTYTVGTGASTITPTATINTYNITYGTVTGISSVSLDGTACTTALSAGGCTKTLTYNETYNLVATPATGYSFTSWSAGDYGSVASASSASTTYTVGAGASTITPTPTINTYNVKVNFAGSGVSSVVFTADGYTTRTVSTSGGTAELTYGVQYTMTMNFTSTSYKFYSWALNSSSYGTLSSTSTNPSYFVPNTSSGDAVITATGKSAICSITEGTVYNFDYTGAAQTFTAACDGNYKVELWGAQGGQYSTTFAGGKGGFVTGEILLSKNQTFYVYVGSAGRTDVTSSNYASTGGYNGGGYGSYQWHCAGGGGATDIRTSSSDAKTRIMVAAGGGGACNSRTYYSSYQSGGHGGGINGVDGSGSYASSQPAWVGRGATQTHGGISTYAPAPEAHSGSFYQGCNSPVPGDDRGGGGGGWYGGGCSYGSVSPGGGGSSYISGIAGFIGIDSSGAALCSEDSSSVACATSYTNYKFTTGSTITGNQSMPNTAGTGNETGHTGNGYARITYLGISI